MKLKITTIKQKQGKSCGPAVMNMVFRYFGKRISEKAIIKEIGGLTKWGSFVTDNALIARKLGFKVICHSYNLEYFEPGFVKLSQKEFIKRVEILIEKEKKKYNKRELESILKVLKSDIDFQMEIPSVDTIRKFLDKKLPVILAVNSAILFQEKEDLKSGHYIVLTGYTKNRFYYNDPAKGKEKTILSDRLIFALSNNVLDSSAYLLVIKK